MSTKDATRTQKLTFVTLTAMVILVVSVAGAIVGVIALAAGWIMI